LAGESVRRQGPYFLVDQRRSALWQSARCAAIRGAGPKGWQDQSRVKEV